MDTMRGDKRDKDCVVLFHVNKRSPDFASGVHDGKTKRNATMSSRMCAVFV